MRVTFWGTRGSIAVPGPATVRYGGNTTCIEIVTDAGTRVILDGGTGIRPLGLERAKAPPGVHHVFLTHTHWDHIQGIPFFAPLFVPGNEVRFYGATEPVSGKPLRDLLLVQHDYSYFPVSEAELSAQLVYRDLTPDVPIEIGDATLTPVLMNHPVTCLGFRVDADGKSVFFTGDHEPPYNIYAPEDPDYAAFEEAVQARRRHLDEALSGVDLLITDAMYTDEEYPRHRGWGHGSVGQCLAWAERLHVEKLCLTHHDPCRHDQAGADPARPPL